MKPIEVKYSDAFRRNTLNLTVDVKLIRDWRFRLGFALIKLGVRVMRSNVSLQETPSV